MKLVKIMPDRVQIKTDSDTFKTARLNDLISISDGEVELVTMITQITDTDAEIPIEDEDILGDVPSVKVIECNILGSIVGKYFKQQVDKFPTTDVEIKKIDNRKFTIMTGGQLVSECLWIGEYCFTPTSACLDGNKFFQRHSCIVGNTGCGKSETVAKILESTVNGAGHPNIIVFDIHGEYGGLSYADNIKMGNETPFPIWMLGFSDMVSNILKVKEDSTVAWSALRKAYYSQCPDGNEGKPTYFSFEKMTAFIGMMNIEEVGTGEFYKTGDRAGKEKTVKGEYNGKLGGIVNTMETIYADKRNAFMFDPDIEAIGEDYLVSFVNRLLSTDKPVKNIDLSDVPHDVAIVIIGAVTKLIYNMQLLQPKDDIRPVTLVCDEAHVYIPVNFQLSASQRRMVEIFEDIAKEGRKFGITLLAASQRPSELNRTIMAMCANYIVMKLNNENDKTMIKGMLPNGTSGVIEQTTMFMPGDCLCIGDACPIPLKIHVELANERPQSRTIDFWDEWKKERERVDYSKILEEYLDG